MVEWTESDCGYTTPCHIWQGARSGTYGWDSAARMSAHRAAWIAENGPIEGPMHIHHLCGIRMCVNVRHLEVLSPGEHRRSHGNPGRRNRLSREAVDDIRSSPEILDVLASRYGISKSYCAKVRRGQAPLEFQLDQPLQPWARGHTKPPRQKSNLTAEDVALIRMNREFSLNELAEMFGMSRIYMNEVRQGRAPKP